MTEKDRIKYLPPKWRAEALTKAFNASKAGNQEVADQFLKLAVYTGRMSLRPPLFNPPGTRTIAGVRIYQESQISIR